MRKRIAFLFFFCFGLSAMAQNEPSLTIYNGNFAAVRESRP